ncbi:DUF6377 domain-containing protein [Salinimicrobium flavum]|uniref:DUF6377 domain-containing protein n=1 Tax=Salinimicrobium flavum TaxID=1737065 RepID=A0ABW5IZV2_9FLAO
MGSNLHLSGQEVLLEELRTTVEKSSEYDQVKIRKIEDLRKELQRTNKSNLVDRYRLNFELFQEYKVFNQDSAYSYGLNTRDLATQLDSLPLITAAVINLADVSVSAGMYKETLDLLETVDPDKIPANQRSLYYGLRGRVYSEMAEYSNLNYYSSQYNELASQFRQKALELTEEGTFFHSFLRAFIKYNRGDTPQALIDFKSLLDAPLLPREKALVHYMLGDIYDKRGEKEEAIVHFTMASLLDVKTSTKETLAIIRLSELLFETDRLKEASFFIQKANEDASFYGAQHRKIQVGAILPLIEEKVISRVEQQRRRLYIQNIIVSFLLLLATVLAVVIYLQVRRLKSARRSLMTAHHDLQTVNQQMQLVNKEIQSKNQQLKKVNDQLLEANKIKEEYIGFFFSRDADLFEKFREFKSRIEKDLKSEDLEKVKFRVKHYDLKKEKEKLLQNFDEAFIRLFPKFIEEFNSLLKEEEQIKLKKGQILNKELRIFALIRLGISHNEIIAQILGYSVNSIYAYKTKIRKRSILHKKEFDQKLIENTTLRF